MTNDDTFLNSQFAAYRDELMADVTPAGPDAVRTTVRHRRRVAITAGSALAIALIAGPAAGYAALSRGPAPPGPGATLEPAISASPSTATPSPSATASAPAAPDGRISKADLLAAKLTLPAWQSDAPSTCTNRGVKLAPQATTGKPGLMLLTYGDVDGDGAQETITILGCRPGEAAMQQVVVFDRDAAGNIRTLGQVTRTGTGFDWITGLKVDQPGSVQVEVGDIQPCCDTPASAARKQWRTYSWNGQAFRQTGGPTEFPKTPVPDLAVTATVVTFQEGADDWRHGTTTVTLKNNGTADAAYVYLSFDFNGGLMRHEGNAWKDCIEVSDTTSTPSSQLFCLLGPLKAGASRTVTFGLVNSLPQPDSGVMTLIVTPMDQNRDPARETVRSNNEVNRDYR